MQTADNALRRTLGVALMAVGCTGWGWGEAAVLPVPDVYPTIQSAVDAAADSDTVLVAPGVYDEFVNVPARPITLASRDDDPLTTILDGSGPGGAGHGQVVLVNQTDRGSQVIRGFTIRKGQVGLYGNSGPFPGVASHDLVIRNNRFVENGPTGALYHAGGQLTLLDNEFVGNQVMVGGHQGAVLNYGSAMIERNLFEGNHVAGGSTSQQGGALRLFGNFPWVGGGGIVTMRANRFLRNESEDEGGALVLGPYITQATIEGNRFEFNRAGRAGGALFAVFGNLSLSQNVFTANEAPHGSAIELISDQAASLFQNTIVGGTEYPSGEAIRVEKSGGSITMDYNVVAFDAGVGVRWVQGFGTVNCNDIYGNAGGGWVGNLPFGSVSTFALDPLFCDRAAAGLTLAANSPCLPAARPCDGTVRVGALGEGCAAVAVQAVTWGRLKAMYGGTEGAPPVPTRRP